MGFRALIAMQFNKRTGSEVKEELFALWFHYVYPEDFVAIIRERTRLVALHYLTHPEDIDYCKKAFEQSVNGDYVYASSNVSDHDISTFSVDIMAFAMVDCRMKDEKRIAVRSDGQPDMEIRALIEANGKRPLPFPKLSPEEIDRICNFYWLHTDRYELRDLCYHLEKEKYRLSNGLEELKKKNDLMRNYIAKLNGLLAEHPELKEEQLKVLDDFGLWDLGIPIELGKVFRHDDIGTLGQICRLSRDDLREKKCREKSIDRLAMVLDGLGLHFFGDDDT